MGMIRVLIVDDHEIVRKGIHQLMETQDDLAVVGQAVDGREGIRMARELQPDIVILDISMPELNGLDSIEHLKKFVPAAKIIIFSMFKKIAYIKQGFSSGALAYVVKTEPGFELLKAVRASLQDDLNLSSSLQKYYPDFKISGFKKVPFVADSAGLTKREIQIMQLVLQGKSTRKIAEFLCISLRTVDKHRENIMNKLNVHSLKDMNIFAIKMGIIDSVCPD